MCQPNDNCVSLRTFFTFRFRNILIPALLWAFINGQNQTESLTFFTIFFMTHLYVRNFFYTFLCCLIFPSFTPSPALWWYCRTNEFISSKTDQQSSDKTTSFFISLKLSFLLLFSSSLYLVLLDLKHVEIFGRFSTNVVNCSARWKNLIHNNSWMKFFCFSLLSLSSCDSTKKIMNEEVNTTYTTCTTLNTQESTKKTRRISLYRFFL